VRGQVVPADQIQRFKDLIARKPIRVLKPGDEVTWPGNRKTFVQPKAVTADKALLLPDEFPSPLSVKRVDGRWRVDAWPIIFVRKAADAARRKRQTE
jgi:hypothetical protein